MYNHRLLYVALLALAMMMMGLCLGIPNTGARPYGHAPKLALAIDEQ